MDENKLDNFDKTNKYHYKALETKQVSSFSASASDDDLPF
jgi:hypothetical protein